MILLPIVSADYCKNRCDIVIQKTELSFDILMFKKLSDSKRLELRTVLDIVDNMAGHFIYPPGGGIDWHDDYAHPGWRVYIAWSETGDSGMIFDEDGVRRVCQDKPGWNVRSFLAPTWHCVWTNCWRYSIGLYLPCMH
jgi:hypothetical protein